MWFILKRFPFHPQRMAEQASSTDLNRRCRRCGAAVSRSFIRVFGVKNEVHGCIDCLPRERLSNGEAAKESDGGPIQDDTQTAWRDNWL